MKRAKVRFDPNKRRVKEAQRAKIAEMKRQQEEEKRRFNRWITNNRSFDFEAHAAKWDKQRKKYAKVFTEQVVSAMGLINGASDANELLSIGLKMPDAGIDLEALHDLAYNIFTVKMAQILVEEANLIGSTKTEVMERIVAQIFPNVDNSKKKIESPADKGDLDREVQAILTSRTGADNSNRPRAR